ncbi:hypothetical protein [Nocardiopsis ansamitocini]|uniref:Secreted protein n=1 Tax=Nocardiopsis ansamitocini TaxID=1670832 RepID=A0A9W6P247_9ACTN|nr:hypothetical protein [Nocardiopsis ansamitocini]GLU45835.1 hypothetical protein Nans01_01860 [Nocardiopsis ansamitocini]
MDTGLMIGLAVFIVLAIIAVAAAAVLVPKQRSQQLKKKFGPEYDRAVDQHQDRKAAERELVDRQKRHSALTLRSLSPETRAEYAAEWTRVQERFVDDPASAVTDADRLMTRVMADRGYPTEGPEQQAADLSVEHAQTIGHYRSARDAVERHQKGGADTEELRTAMVHYRTLFGELLEEDVTKNDHAGGEGRTTVPESREDRVQRDAPAESATRRDTPETR